MPTPSIPISYRSPIGGRRIGRSPASWPRCRARRGWRSSAAGMPGSRRRWSLRSTGSMRWCSSRARSGSARLHPALYCKGLLEACRRRGVRVCAEAAVDKITASGAGWRVETSRGSLLAGDVVIATNGYTGTVTPALRRRIVPIASHIIATEQLAPELALSLIPRGRSISDTKRVLCYYRLSPDRTRMVFGGRARFTPADPELCARVLHGYMSERFAQLRGARVTHSWTGNTAFTLDALPHMGEEGGLHYCLGCNGSGVAM